MREQEFSKSITSQIKGVAIIMMMIHHCFLNEKRFVGHTVVFAPLPQEVAMKIASFFKICVAIYVFITAYGLSKSIVRSEQNGTSNNSVPLSGNRFADPHRTARSGMARWMRLWFNYVFIFALFLIFGKVNNHFHFVSSNWGFHKVYGHDGMKSLVYFLTDVSGLAHIFRTPTFNGTWWYMSLAFLLIFSVPILVRIYEKYRLPVVLLAGLVPRYIGLNETIPARYLLVTMVGIMMASEGFPEKIQRFVTRSVSRYIISGILPIMSTPESLFFKVFQRVIPE